MEESNDNKVPFDMAKETLKSIRSWIDKLTELSVGVYGGQVVDPNEMIILKHKMVRQLIVLASPLLREHRSEIEDFFSKIDISYGDIRSGTKWTRNTPVYSKEVDYQLDECVQGIEEALDKYFTPSFSEGERYYG